MLILSKVTHHTLGLIFECHTDNNRIILTSCIASTPTTRISRWHSTLRQSILVAIIQIPVDNITDVSTRITALRSFGTATTTITLIPKKHINICPDINMPQIHFNQMNVMTHQHFQLEMILPRGPTHITPTCQRCHGFRGNGQRSYQNQIDTRIFKTTK